MDLSNIKVAVFDFDDTLAIHKNKDYDIMRKDKENEYYMKAYLNPDTFFDTIEPCMINEKLLNLIVYLRGNNVKLYCLSGMSMSLHLKAKENFVHKYYGNDIEMLLAASQDKKIDVVKILQKVNNCNADEILFVDDLGSVVAMMKENGFIGLKVEHIKYLNLG